MQFKPSGLGVSQNDDVSDGSYMVKGNNNNMPSDMQSTGSYMVKVSGRKQNDDMQSTGSYMVKG